MRESANTINQQQLQPIHIIELFIVAQTVLAGKQHSCLASQETSYSMMTRTLSSVAILMACCLIQGADALRSAAPNG
jgi:hypothetical protein